MVTLQKITWYNFKKVISLKVTPEQEDFIADNLYRLAQSYVALSNGEKPYPFAAFDDDECIGFVLMAFEEKGTTDEDGRVSEENEFYICRFMIDKDRQGKGYGRELLKLCIEWIIVNTGVRPLVIRLSYNEDNEVARKLYTCCGFVETGETTDTGEVVAKLYIR